MSFNEPTVAKQEEEGSNNHITNLYVILNSELNCKINIL